MKAENVLKYFLVTAAFAAGGFISPDLSGLTCRAVADTKPANPVIVKFSDGTTIRLQELQKIHQANPNLSQAPFEMVFTPLRAEAISTHVLDKVVSKDKKIDANPEVKEAIAKCAKSVKRDFFMREAIKKKVTDKDIKAKYDEFAASFRGQDAVELKHILVQDAEEASKIIGKLNKGEDFDKLAQLHSLDPNSKEGKSLGMLPKDAMPVSIGEVAFGLKVGEYAKKPVVSDFGVHVIKVVAKGKAKAPSFEEVKPDIQAGMSQMAIQQIILDLIHQQEPSLKVFEIDGSPAPTPNDEASKTLKAQQPSDASKDSSKGAGK